MKVKALNSFASTDKHYADGEIFTLPEGVDWLECGLVELVEEQPKQEAPKPKSKKKNDPQTA